MKHASEVGADRWLVGAELGLLGMNDQVAIDGSPTGLLDPLDHLCQETRAIGSLPLGIGIRVMLSNVTQAGSTQEGVGDGMTHHVGVGVSHQSRGWAILSPPSIRGRPSLNRCVSCPMPTRTLKLRPIKNPISQCSGWARLCPSPSAIGSDGALPSHRENARVSEQSSRSA